MNLTRWLFLLGILGFVTLGASGQTPSPAGASGNFGKITAKRVTGAVTAKLRGSADASAIRVVDDMQLTEGQIVNTPVGGSVVLVFSNGASLNVGTDSTLDIQHFVQDQYQGTPSAAMTDEPSKSNTRVKLTKGELVGRVAKLKDKEGSSFTVETPVGAAGIRGTVFRIVYRPTGTGTNYQVQFTTQEGEIGVALNTGVTTGPVQGVAANQEIAIIADITTNAATGVVTMTLPPPPGSAPGTPNQTITVKQADITNLNSTQAANDAIAAIIVGVVLPTASITVVPPSAPAEDPVVVVPLVVTTPTPTPPVPEPPPPPPPPAPPVSQVPNSTTPQAGLP